MVLAMCPPDNCACSKDQEPAAIGQEQADRHLPYGAECPHLTRLFSECFQDKPLNHTDPTLLAEFDGELALGLGHLAPEFLQVILQCHIIGLLVQSEREPAIGGRQVAGRAGARGVEHSHRNHCFHIGLLRRWLQQAQSPVAILPHAAPVDVALRLGRRIDWRHWSRLALAQWRFAGYVGLGFARRSFGISRWRRGRRR